jgi:predicted RNA-binding protein YlqC (UPF0109 family)
VVEELEGLVKFMAENLVEDPETVQVESQSRGRIVTVTLTVPQGDMGKVIGRQGRIARAMRTLLTIAASRNGYRASLDING